MIIGLGHKIKAGKDTVAKMINFFMAYNDMIKENNYTSELTLMQEYKDFLEQEDYIHNLRPYFEIKRFADKVKEIVALLIGCTLEDLEDHNFKNKELGQEWWYYKFGENVLISYLDSKTDDREAVEKYLVKLTPRLLFNLVGTESGRKIIHPNIWVNALFSQYYATLYHGDDKYPDLNVCVGPTKFPNYKDHPDLYPNWIITDVRFPNEANSIKNKEGVLVKIQRDFCFDSLEDYLVTYPDKRISQKASQLVSEFKGGYPELLEHFARLFPDETKQYLSGSHKLESETALDDYTGWDDVIDNNGTEEQLLLNVEAFLKRHKII